MIPCVVVVSPACQSTDKETAVGGSLFRGVPFVVVEDFVSDIPGDNKVGSGLKITQ